MNDKTNTGFGFVEQELEETNPEQNHKRQSWADPMELAAHEITGRMNAKAGLAQLEDPNQELYQGLMDINSICSDDAAQVFEDCLEAAEIEQDVKNVAYEAAKMADVVEDYTEAREKGVSGQITGDELLETVGYGAEVFNPEMVTLNYGEVQGTVPGGKEMGFVPHTIFKNIREIAEQNGTELNARFDLYQADNTAVLEVHDDAGEYPEDVDLGEGFNREEYNGSGMGLQMTAELVHATGGEIYSETSELAHYDKKTVIELPKNQTPNSDSYKIEETIVSD